MCMSFGIKTLQPTISFTIVIFTTLRFAITALTLTTTTNLKHNKYQLNLHIIKLHIKVVYNVITHTSCLLLLDLHTFIMCLSS